MDKMDDIMKMWEQMNRRLDQLNTSLVDESRRVASSNIRSARKSLMRRSKLMVIFCFICAVLFPTEFSFIPADEDGIVGFGVGYWRIISILIFLAYFLICGISSVRLYLKIQDVNLSTMSISDISDRVREIKSTHLRMEVVEVILAVFVLIEFFYVLSIGNKWLLIPGLVGMLIGLAVALPLFFRFMSDYRRMIYPYDEDEI